ncbi:uncharacterized protein LOC132096669 isoform X3 [Carassius carassius]|uniref:uncharacterized protein LOC132096669 isoform X3 n=1 Tax=Carassius carassius TaxID=217509 RepID=UPI0028685239|nr:uncharacterized protein LOC132096669 isoform X3 [Carassius carassius]
MNEGLTGLEQHEGRGVFTTGAFFRGDFVLEYRGELLSSQESLDRTEHYTEAENTFLFDFQWHGKNWCMDASKEDSSLGRLANDETRNPTCKMRTVEVSRKPHLCLFAVRDILPGEEITYNYGDSDWPWRVKPLNKASAESTDKKPASSLRLHKSSHCAASVSSPELDKVNSNGPHKQSGKARTSRNKTKQFQSRLLQSSSVASTSDAPSSSAPCALFTSIMALSTSCPPALSSSPSTPPAPPTSPSTSPVQPSSSSPAYRGGECINKAACECGIKNPEALSSTRLRKHIATMSKILNLNENEADQLADFLGHDIRIHRQYYRLPEGTLQLAKMSKVLMAMEKGTLSDYKGKKLDDIEIDPNEQLEAQGDSMSSDEEDSSDLSQSTAPVKTDQPVQSDQAVSQEDQGSSNAPKKKWEDSEVKAVERHMMSFIKTCKVPGKQDCERCIHAEPEALKQRTWTGVKNYVRNKITTLKRKGGL